MIYCSYSRKDRPVVQRVCQALTEKGIQLFVDYEQLSGGDYAQELTKQIESAEAILFFYSKNTENSTWVKHEIEFALSKNKCIIPLILSEPEGSSWLKFHLGTINWIKVVGKEINGITNNIINALDSLSLENKDLSHKTTGNVADHGTKRSPQLGKAEGVRRKKKLGYWIIVMLGLIALFLSFALIYVGSPNLSNYPDGQNKYGHYRRIHEVRELRHNPPIWQLLLVLTVPFITGCGVTFLMLRIRKSKKKNIKLSSDIASKISIDGNLQKEIESREVYTTHLEKGEYLIDFEDKKDENRHKTFNHEVTSKDCKLIYANFLEESSQNGKTIKCFIAGSKTLQQERDALRAVTCVMYNKWDSKNFRILSYTFEDFKKEHTLVPPQEMYNKFIEEEANWALFIIDGEIGGITVNEYRIAMDSFKRNGRPKILALAKVGSENDEKVAEIRDEINKEHQYWTDYTDILSLKYIFESTLNWDLIRLFQDI